MKLIHQHKHMFDTRAAICAGVQSICCIDWFNSRPKADITGSSLSETPLENPDRRKAIFV